MSTVAAPARPAPGAQSPASTRAPSGASAPPPTEDDRAARTARRSDATVEAADAGDHAVVVDRDAARDDGRGAQPRRRGHGAVGVVGRVADRLRVALVLLPAPAPVERRRRRRVRGRDPLRLPQAPAIRPPVADHQRGAARAGAHPGHRRARLRVTAVARRGDVPVPADRAGEVRAAALRRRSRQPPGARDRRLATRRQTRPHRARRVRLPRDARARPRLRAGARAHRRDRARRRGQPARGISRRLRSVPSPSSPSSPSPSRTDGRASSRSCIRSPTRPTRGTRSRSRSSRSAAAGSPASASARAGRSGTSSRTRTPTSSSRSSAKSSG